LQSFAQTVAGLQGAFAARPGDAGECGFVDGETWADWKRQIAAPRQL